MAETRPKHILIVEPDEERAGFYYRNIASGLQLQPTKEIVRTAQEGLEACKKIPAPDIIVHGAGTQMSFFDGRLALEAAVRKK